MKCNGGKITMKSNGDSNTMYNLHHEDEDHMM